MFLAMSAIILTLILVIGVHEGGHALAARFFKVKISRISIGFGKSLIRWKTRDGCEWVWGFLPLGGYVQLENTRIKPVTPSEYSHCFDKKPIWQRIFILLAGAAANLVTAWFAFIIVYLVGLSYIPPEIKAVEPNSLAAQTGVLPGDHLISIGGKMTPTWNDIGMQLIILWGKKDIPATLTRVDGRETKVMLDLSHVPLRGVRLSLLEQLGIKPNLSGEKSVFRMDSIGDAVSQSNATIGTMVYFFLMILKHLFSGVIPFSVLLGPLGIFAVSVFSLGQGVVYFLFFIANLSLAVAVINLFPIPGLDGGSILYAVLEKIRGKPVSVAMEVLVHRLVFIGFCMVLIHLLMNDVQRI